MTVTWRRRGGSAAGVEKMSGEKGVPQPFAVMSRHSWSFWKKFPLILLEKPGRGNLSPTMPEKTRFTNVRGALLQSPASP